MPREDPEPRHLRLQLVGQHDTRRGAELRGNEDLGELRVGVTGGRHRWVRVELVRGWREFSPSLGLTVELGFD